MMFLLTCDKKLTKSQLTKRKITDELKHNAGWYEVREGSPVEVQWAELRCSSRRTSVAAESATRVCENIGCNML